MLVSRAATQSPEAVRARTVADTQMISKKLDVVLRHGDEQFLGLLAAEHRNLVAGLEISSPQGGEVPRVDSPRDGRSHGQRGDAGFQFGNLLFDRRAIGRFNLQLRQLLGLNEHAAFYERLAVGQFQVGQFRLEFIVLQHDDRLARHDRIAAGNEDLFDEAGGRGPHDAQAGRTRPPPAPQRGRAG